jgi:hypothetical protein
MSRSEIELQCECARCGKSAYHTVRWLRENVSVQCERCNAVMRSDEILRDNSKIVRESDDARHRDTND